MEQLSTQSLCHLCKNEKSAVDTWKYSCNHILCKTCFLKALLEPHDISSDAVILKCKCDNGVLDFPLAQLHDLLESDSPFCNYHKLTMKKYCTECIKWICEECHNGHNENPSLQEHQLLLNKPNEYKKCPLHPSLYLDLYCRMCRKEICQICTVQGNQHAQHEYESIENYTNNLRKKIPLGSLTIEELNSHFDQLSTRLKDKLYANVVTVNEKLDELSQAIDEFRKKYNESSNLFTEKADIIISVEKNMYLNSKTNDISILKFLMAKKSDSIEAGIKSEDTFLAQIEQITKNIQDMGKNLQIGTIISDEPKEPQFETYQTLTGHSSYIYSIIQLHDGRIASGSEDTSIKIWEEDNAGKFICTNTLSKHTGPVWFLLNLSQDSFASASADLTIKIWKIKGNEITCTQNLKKHTDFVYCLSILWTDGRLASGSSDHSIILWKNKKGGYIAKEVLNGHSGSVWATLQLKDKRLSSASTDTTVKIWTEYPNKGFKCTQTLSGHGGGAWSILEFKEGWIAVGAQDKALRIWAVNSNGSFELKYTLTGHNSFVWMLIHLKDGRIASGSGDRTVKLWDPETFVCLQTVTGHNNSVCGLVQLKDGRISTGSCDNTMRIWD